MLDHYDSVPQESKDIIDAIFEGSAKHFIEGCRTSYNHNEFISKKNMNEYFSEVEKQKFTKLDENSQKSYLELAEAVIEAALGNTKRQLEHNINYFKKMVKFGEEMFAGLSELGTTPDLEKAKQDLQEQKDIIIDCEKKLSDDYNQADEHYSHRIPMIEKI